jgi:hypothetical protein
MLYQFGVGCGFDVWRHFKQYISQYIVGVSFIGIGGQETTDLPPVTYQNYHI